MAALTSEERLQALEVNMARLEQSVAQLKAAPAQTTTQNAAPWWKKIVGVYKDDPEFEEAMRIGREYRQSQFEST